MADPRVRRYCQVAEALRDGQFDVSVPIGTRGEIADLGQALRDLAQTLKQQSEKSEMISNITRKINEGLMIEDILDQVYDNFFALIPYDRIGFALLEDGRAVVRAHWARSEAEEIKLPLGYSAGVSGSSLEEVMKTQQPRILNDLEAYLDDHPNSDSTRRIVDEGMRSSLTCPLVIMGQPVGFLFFSSMQKDTYRDVHKELYLQIASQLAVTLEKSRLYEGLLELTEELKEARDSLELLATRDSLTGLWNRRSITDLLSRDLSRAGREELSLVAVIVDVDFFKNLNDTIGHLAGDEVLKEITRRISCTLRTADVFGRIGGEEFLIILYPANEKTAVEVMERARRACAGTPIKLDAGEYQVTVSLGAAVVQEFEDIGLADVLKTADHALYRAKNDGRNRSVVEMV